MEESALGRAKLRPGLRTNSMVLSRGDSLGQNSWSKPLPRQRSVADGLRRLSGIPNEISQELPAVLSEHDLDMIGSILSTNSRNANARRRAAQAVGNPKARPSHQRTPSYRATARAQQAQAKREKQEAAVKQLAQFLKSQLDAIEGEQGVAVKELAAQLEDERKGMDSEIEELRRQLEQKNEELHQLQQGNQQVASELRRSQSELSDVSEAIDEACELMDRFSSAGEPHSARSLLSASSSAVSVADKATKVKEQIEYVQAMARDVDKHRHALQHKMRRLRTTQLQTVVDHLLRGQRHMRLREAFTRLRWPLEQDSKPCASPVSRQPPDHSKIMKRVMSLQEVLEMEGGWKEREVSPASVLDGVESIVDQYIVLKDSFEQLSLERDMLSAEKQRLQGKLALEQAKYSSLQGRREVEMGRIAMKLERASSEYYRKEDQEQASTLPEHFQLARGGVSQVSITDPAGRGRRASFVSQSSLHKASSMPWEPDWDEHDAGVVRGFRPAPPSPFEPPPPKRAFTLASIPQ